MKRRPRIGAFIRIALGEESYAYARLIGKYLFSFYVIKVPDRRKENLIEQLKQEKQIFSTTVDKDVFTKSNWEVIGCDPLEEKILNNMPVFFRQSLYDKSDCWLITTDPDFTKRIKPEDCVNMEREASWQFNAIEGRLRDYIANRSNVTVEGLKVKL